ncbi:MAG: hypothetical protein NTY36_10845 [Deltaproteobacteria bacterium]|nr:hypothetical protein [Deltaproteobacteria bacterium]
MTSQTAERKKLISELQVQRGGRLCLSYITSTRQGHEIQIADDVLRLFYEHLEVGAEAAKKGVDLFLHSNGGSGTAPWRIVSLIREYTKNLAILVPDRAFSAATLIALGANEIIMHKMGCLGPIDPSVANIFNPPNPVNPGQLSPISVEDVTAYFKLVSEELGITHDDELVQALMALTEKVHPLALGNVQRSHNQARMMAIKLLKLHMPKETDEPEIMKIIDTLKSNLFFHGHPINRKEAKVDLKLKVSNPPNNLATLMRNLYVEYEKAMQLNKPFHPTHEMEVRAKAEPAKAPFTTEQILKQLQQLAQKGLGIGSPGISEEQLVKLAVAMIPHVGAQSPPDDAKLKLEGIVGAYVESQARTDVFKTDMRIERMTVVTPAGPQPGVRQEVLWQRWEEEK